MLFLKQAKQSYLLLKVIYPIYTPHPVVADFMSDASTYLSLAQFYQEKTDHFLKLLENSSFQFIPTAGTYFQLLDYSAISDLDDNSFARELIIKYGVASIPLSPFYHSSRDRPPGTNPRLLRFCFAKTNDILELAAEKLCRI